MTTNLVLPHQAGGRATQATAIEQGRAVAEVEAAAMLAWRRPRDTDRAIEKLMDACGRLELAQQASYRFPQGGSTVSGPTIVLMREIARCWGNIQWGLYELAHHTDSSELMAWAWDMEDNVRSAATIVLPHRNYTANGIINLDTVRAVIDNNTSAGSRKVRQVLSSVIPSWFVEMAKARCQETLEGLNDGGKKQPPLPERIRLTVKWFADHGITLSQLESKVGREHGEWDATDAALLGNIWRSVARGEISLATEFPATTIDDVDISRATANTLGLSQIQFEQIKQAFWSSGKSDDQLNAWMAGILIRPVVGFSQLSGSEADLVIAELPKLGTHQEDSGSDVDGQETGPLTERLTELAGRPPEDKARQAEMRRVFVHLGKVGISGNSSEMRDTRLRLAAGLLGVESIGSYGDLTLGQVQQLAHAVTELAKAGGLAGEVEKYRSSPEVIGDTDDVDVSSADQVEHPETKASAGPASLGTLREISRIFKSVGIVSATVRRTAILFMLGVDESTLPTSADMTEDQAVRVLTQFRQWAADGVLANTIHDIVGDESS